MQRFRELLRYGAVGLTNAFTYLTLYSGMVLVGVPYGLAAVAAFPIPAVLGYWLHEHWTFARGEPTASRLGAFLLLQSGSLALSLLLLVALVDGFGVDPIPARVITAPFAPVFVYIVSRAFVFAKPSKAPAPAVIRELVP
jgi:putative flippase GtrA